MVVSCLQVVRFLHPTDPSSALSPSAHTFDCELIHSSQTDCFQPDHPVFCETCISRESSVCLTLALLQEQLTTACQQSIAAEACIRESRKEIAHLTKELLTCTLAADR